MLESVLDGAALHAGIGPPWAVGINVAAEIAVVHRIGIDEHAGGAGLLRHVHLDAAEIFAVTRQHDLAAHVHAHVFELLEILGASVVGVNHFGLDVTRRRVGAERHDDARIVLEGVALDVLAGGPVHDEAGGREGIHADLDGIVHPDFVLDDLGVEAPFAELARDVIGRLAVLGRAGHVRRGGQDFHVPLGLARVGHGKELLLEGRRMRRRGLRRLRDQRRAEKKHKDCGLTKTHTLTSANFECKGKVARRKILMAAIRKLNHGLARIHTDQKIKKSDPCSSVAIRG